jgi:hypothetical protein
MTVSYNVSVSSVVEIGWRYGRLVVLCEAGRTWNTDRRTYLFRCDCGNEVVVEISAVRYGKTVSCGCWRREVLRRGEERVAAPEVAARRSRHGHSGREQSATYRSWRAMRERCFNPSAAGYEYYGGRGITVCDRWRNFSSFLLDLGERPEGTTLDRIDSDGDYEPANCRWASPVEQAANRRPKRAVA